MAYTVTWSETNARLTISGRLNTPSAPVYRIGTNQGNTRELRLNPGQSFQIAFEGVPGTVKVCVNDDCTLTSVCVL